MSRLPEGFASIPGICEVELVGGDAGMSGRPADLLIELQHGATRRTHYDAVRQRLASELPEGLEQFFFVNTDVGTPELAGATARRLTDGTDGGLAILIVRSLIPRTFIDCNRFTEPGPAGQVAGGMTPGVPPYVRAAQDRALLEGWYDRYQAVVDEAFRQICGAGGLAITLHSYAPRSVGIDQVDDRIVSQLRWAYDPARYETWPLRPEVDLIVDTVEGERPAPADLVRLLKERYAAAGVEVAENATYRLHPATTAHVHSLRYPGHVLCLEVRRDLLADPFTPFEEMRIGVAQVERMAEPIAAAICRLNRGSGPLRPRTGC